MVRSVGPGPGKYLLPSTVGYDQHDVTKHRSPMYAFGIKPQPISDHQASPGPIYDVKKFTERGLIDAPAWSLSSRPTDISQFQGPGPGTYSPENCPPIRSAPKHVFGRQLGNDWRTVGPGPNAYSLKSVNDGKYFSLAARFEGQKTNQSPGPAAYYPKNIEAYKRGEPKYTIAGRLDDHDRGQNTPGPANYGPDLYMPGKTPEKFSFGVRHGEETAPYFTELDKFTCEE